MNVSGPACYDEITKWDGTSFNAIALMENGSVAIGGSFSGYQGMHWLNSGYSEKESRCQY